MKILLIDNTLDQDSWGSSELASHLHQVPGSSLWIRRAPHQDLPSPEQLKTFDRIVLSGSRTSANDRLPWTDKLDHLIQQILERGTPLLGICYGHQAIGRVLGGDTLNVRRAERHELGWTEIRRTMAVGNNVLKGLPETFYSFSMHFDEVIDVPENATLLAGSIRCPIQAFAVNDKPVFGIQFHPERDAEAGERTLAQRRKQNSRLELLHAGHGKRLHSPEVAKTIFGNFMKGTW